MACIITVQPQVFLGSDVAFEEFVLRNKICFYPDPHVTTCELSLTPSYTILHPSQRVPLKKQHPPISSAPRTLNHRIVSEDSDEPQTKAAWDARLTARNHAAQGPGEAAQGPGAHNEGRCRPCVFFSIGGCRASDGCRYCHEFHRKVGTGKTSAAPCAKDHTRHDQGPLGEMGLSEMGYTGILQNDHLNWRNDEKPLDFGLTGQ